MQSLNLHQKSYFAYPMIKAVLFDLDGTLVQTELLKAQSYAEAIHDLSQQVVAVDEVLNVFGNYVGLSRAGVVEGLSREFKDPLQKVFPSDNYQGTLEDWVITRRLSIYHKMIGDLDLLEQHFCPYNLGLLHALHSDGYRIGLATMSNRTEVDMVVGALGIGDKLELIMTREDVGEGKPDPEIYLKASDRLHLASNQCLVMEDSVNGIRAGLAAGMTVFAITNYITRASVHQAQLLEPEFIIDELQELRSRVYNFLEKEV